jgi:hypothetical protein
MDEQRSTRHAWLRIRWCYFMITGRFEQVRCGREVFNRNIIVAASASDFTAPIYLPPTSELEADEELHV